MVATAVAVPVLALSLTLSPFELNVELVDTADSPNLALSQSDETVALALIVFGVAFTIIFALAVIVALLVTEASLSLILLPLAVELEEVVELADTVAEPSASSPSLYARRP
jgi:uncharacterized membrane protein